MKAVMLWAIASAVVLVAALLTDSAGLKGSLVCGLLLAISTTSFWSLIKSK